MAKKYIDPEPLTNALKAIQKRSQIISVDEVLGVLAKYPAADIPRWIPVAEALPTQYGDYFVTMRNNAFGYWQVDIATFSPKYDKWSSCDADGFYFIGEKGMAVIAWMPLPEPYKGGEEE